MRKNKYLDRTTNAKRCSLLAFFLLGGYVLFTRRTILLGLMDDGLINENYATLDYINQSISNLGWIAPLGQFLFWSLIGLSIYGIWLLAVYSWNGLRNFYIVQKFYVNKPDTQEIVKYTTKELIAFGLMVIFFVFTLTSLIPFWLNFGLSALNLGLAPSAVYLFVLAWFGLSFTLYINFGLYRNLVAVRRGLL
jgi:hypothetical protein